jgi:hypothetical protein
VGVTPVGECPGGRWGEHHGWVGGWSRLAGGGGAISKSLSNTTFGQ